ncbi:antiviral reverse transcriptase Drt2 [Rubritalea tangerina]|uniref:Antiviral reverse transcriptase Drt2 n=1 Tax=Rubritalea tangerina TaxID=430798 RepID=A0ABW4Z8V4_9BACT
MSSFRYKKRGYLHFDSPLSEENALALATSTERVTQHAFYPLIGYTITTPRISKGENGEFLREDKDRPIKVCAHSDAAIYSYYAHQLSELYEAELEIRNLTNAVTAFRSLPGRQMNNIAFADEVFRYIQANRPCIAIGLDVRKFFDHLDHTVLLEQWKQLLEVERLPSDHYAIYKSLTSFCYVERKDVYERFEISVHNPMPKHINRRRVCSSQKFREVIRGEGFIKPNPEHHNRRGIPQGTPISAILSNIYMLEFDTTMLAKAKDINGLYRRYCDDIIFVVPPNHRHDVHECARDEIQRLNLEIHPDKVCVVEYPSDPSLAATHGKALQYLGFTFDGQKKLIRASSLSRYYSKMRRGVRLAKLHQLKHNKIELSKGLRPSPLKTRKVQIQYSYLIRRRFKNRKDKAHGRTNFITYALDAAKRMNAPEIKRQIKGHVKAIRKESQKPLPYRSGRQI